MSGALKQAVEWRLIRDNPTRLVKLPKRKRREFTVFNPEQAAQFLRTVSKSPHAAPFSCALETAMRPEEYLAIKWSDIDPSCGMVMVQRTLLRRSEGGWVFEECKTDKSRRSIPLSAALLKLLQRHKKEQLEYRMKNADDYKVLDLVFANLNGEPLDHDNVASRHFRPILKDAELPAIRLYDLRHTCATLLLVAGENPKVVSERLGHASVAITLDTYSHVLPNMQDQATSRLAELIYKPKSKKKQNPA